MDGNARERVGMASSNAASGTSDSLETTLIYWGKISFSIPSLSLCFSLKIHNVTRSYIDKVVRNTSSGWPMPVFQKSLLFYKDRFIACVGVSLKCKCVVCGSWGCCYPRWIQRVEYISCFNNGIKKHIDHEWTIFSESQIWLLEKPLCSSALIIGREKKW